MAWAFYGEQANHDIVHSAWPLVRDLEVIQVDGARSHIREGLSRVTLENSLLPQPLDFLRGVTPERPKHLLGVLPEQRRR